MDILIVYVFITSNVALCFLPRQAPEGHKDTKTHYDITNKGTLEAISEYIFDTKLANGTSISTALDEFFAKDKKGKDKLYRTISDLRSAVADTQANKKNISFVHCDAEQILLAHNHVISCRQGVFDRKDNLDEMRKQLGECLYTIQSFYSSTNWVEMSGSIPYLDFGDSRKQLNHIAQASTPTCADLPNIDKNCSNNLLVINILTSGYHHGRGNTKKPAIHLGHQVGKCSHGGPDDDSRNMSAKCGINKDTTDESLSPHFYLHNEAYKAAVAATKHFLIGDDIGILSLIGNETFDSLFNIKRREQVSLSFALDYSGSMADEINVVKNQIIQLVTSTRGSDNEPADYVLSLFNDPVDLNKVFITDDGLKMIEKVSEVSADGGDDCPEYAAAGILKAIEVSRIGSTVMVFTDADAKDKNRLGEVTDAALAKQIKVTSLLTGTCSGRRKRDRNEKPFFQALADSTGGKLYESSKKNIGNVLNEVIQDVFPTSAVIIESYQMKPSNTDHVIAVDGSIQVLKISITGASSSSDVDLIYPNGTVETFTTWMASRIFTDKKEIIMSLQKPSAAEYVLHRNKNNSVWMVNVTAQSSISLYAELIHHTDGGFPLSVEGSPVTGYRYTLILTVFNFQNGKCNYVLMLDEFGEEMDSLVPDQSRSDIDTLCVVSFTTPDSAFQFKLNGTDPSGHVFYRSLSTVYKPSSLDLRVKTPLEDIPIHKEKQIPFEVVNNGQIVETCRVKFSDDHSFVTPPNEYMFNISVGESEMRLFSVFPRRTGFFTYNISLFCGDTLKAMQAISNSILVTSIQRPECSIIDVETACNSSALNTANCSKYQWDAAVSISFSGPKIKTLISTAGNYTALTYKNITDLTEGTFTVNVSGTCCTPSVTITVIDVDGYLSQCLLDLSDGKPVISVEPEEVKIKPVDPPKPDDTDDNKIIAVSVCLSMILVAIVMGIIIHKIIQHHSKTQYTLSTTLVKQN